MIGVGGLGILQDLGKLGGPGKPVGGFDRQGAGNRGIELAGDVAPDGCVLTGQAAAAANRSACGT